MTRKQISIVVVIAFFVGAVGNMFFERFLFPRMAVLPGFSWLAKIYTNPVVVIKREEVVLNEGANFVELSKQLGNRTVSIYTSIKNSPKLLGNGIILSSDGLIITSKEVISSNSQVSVILNDGRHFDGLVRALDPKSELVILTITAKDLAVAEFSDAYSLQTGQKVLAIGNSSMEYARKFSSGVVNQIVADDASLDKVFSSEILADTFKTDAALQNEYVGGPVAGLNGKIVGMVVNSTGKILVSEHMRTALVSYLQSGRIVRPYLGLRYLKISGSHAGLRSLPKAGVLVTDTEAGSPARKAGLTVGDLVTEFDGDKLEQQNLETLLNNHSLGEVRLKIIRDSKALDLTIDLEATK